MMDREHFPDTFKLVPNPAWPDFGSDTGVFMDDHHLAAEKVAVFSQDHLLLQKRGDHLWFISIPSFCIWHWAYCL